MRFTTLLFTLVSGFVAGGVFSAAHVYPRGLNHQYVMGLSHYEPSVGLVPTALGEQFPGIVAALATPRAPSQPPVAPSVGSTSAPAATPQPPLGCEQELVQCLADQKELLSDICPASSAAANP